MKTYQEQLASALEDRLELSERALASYRDRLRRQADAYTRYVTEHPEATEDDILSALALVNVA